MAIDTGFGIVRFFDDFLVTTFNADAWTTAVLSSAPVFAVNVQVNGVIRGGVANDSSNDYSVIYGELLYEADDGGPLVFEARIKPITDLSCMYFVGLSDEKTAEMPIDYNAGSLTTTASDAVGFYYAGGVSNATWRYGGVAGNTDSDQAAASSIYNPVLNTYQTLRVVIDLAGVASFFINGNIIKENVSGCLTAGTSVMPFIAIRDDGAAGSLDVDYVYVSKGRV